MNISSAEPINALVTPWNEYNLIYTFPSLKLLAGLRWKILIALNWSRWMWYSDLVKLLPDTWWGPPNGLFRLLNIKQLFPRFARLPHWFSVHVF